MSNLTTLPKGDSAWLLRKSIQRIIQQVSVLETNIGSSTTGNSSNTQIIFNDAGTLRGDSGLTYNKTTDVLSVGAATITGDLTVDTNVLKVDTTNNRVGVVNASPSFPLDVVGDVALTGNENYVYLFSSYSIGNNSRVRFRAVGAGGGSGYGGDFRISTRASNNSWNTDVLTIDSSANCIWTDGAGGTRMTLNSAGLGVGLVPSAGNGKFQVLGGVGYDGQFNLTAQFVDVITSASKGVLLGYNNTTNNGIISAAYGNGTEGLTFWTHDGSSWGQRMELTATGNVGIGVTPSASDGTLRTLNVGYTGVMYGFVGTSEAAGFGSNYYYNAGWKYRQNGFATNLSTSSGKFVFSIASSGTAGNLVNGGSGVWTDAMTLDASGNLLVGPTSANASGGVLQLSSGITFPATQVASSDANTLDDYEEGSWTPSITFGGASVGMTGTFAGRYTKVGRAVTINGIMALTAKGSSTGLAKITGLPFVSANSAAEYTAISIRLDRVSFSDAPCGYIGPNVIVVELENTTNAGTVTNLTEANFINTSVVIINSTYTV